MNLTLVGDSTDLALDISESVAARHFSRVANVLRPNEWFHVAAISASGAFAFVNIKQGKFRHEELARNDVTDFVWAPDGSCWIATGQRATVVTRSGVKIASPKDGLPGYGLTAISADPDGLLWFGSEDFRYPFGVGIARFDGTTFKVFSDFENLPNRNVLCLDATLSGEIWFGTRNGIARLRGTEWSKQGIES